MTATQGDRYATAWIPAGATAHFTAADIQILPSTYVGNGRGEYIYRATLLEPASGGTVWSKWNFAAVGIVWGGGPYEWLPLGSRYIGAWTNNTGVSKALLVKTSAERSYAGAGTRYTLKVSVTGGNGDAAPGCGDDDWVRGALGPQVDGGAAGDPVNTGSGNFYDTVVDVPRVGALGDALLERTYNAMDPGVVVDAVSGRPGVFGRGWTSWLDTSLTPVGAEALVYREPTGRQVDIGRASDGSWTLPADMDASLTETTGGRTLSFQGGRSVTFDRHGRIVAADDGNGDTVRVNRDAETAMPQRAVFRWHGAERATLSFTDVDADGLVRGRGSWRDPAELHLRQRQQAHRRLCPASVWSAGTCGRDLRLG